MVWRYGTWQPTSWNDALDLVARVTARVIDKDDEDDLFVSMFDHGGSAGGYENTWGTGKLYFDSMKVKNCRIHNRPAYNSEVHSTRDMGIGELNYAYEDYGLTDTIFLIGANPLETQTNLFLNHMIPGMRGGAKVIIVDPRRTVTANACEIEAGAENVLHLAINSGTDLALFNTLFTYITDQGWVDQDFIAASTFQGDVAQPQNDALEQVVNAYQYETPAQHYNNIISVTPKKTKIEDDVYMRQKVWKYAGSDAAGPIQKIVAIGYRDAGVTNFSILVQDATNGMPIAEATFTNTTEDSELDLGAIQNIPSTMATFEIYLKMTGGGDNDFAYVEDVTFYI